MTEREYDEFWSYAKTAWPALQDWLNRLDDLPETAGIWFDTVFVKVSLADCKTVIDETTAGRLNQPPFGRIPAFFRCECGALHFERVQADQKGREHWRGAHEALRASGAGPAFRKAQAMIRQLKAEGKTDREAVRIVNGPRRDEWAKLITTKG